MKIIEVLFPFIGALIFVLTFGIILFALIQGIGEWNKDNRSPLLTVPAKVVAKRTDVSRRHTGTDHMTASSTTYYVTFEVESGDRMELPLSGQEYGLLAEGDSGHLTFQGTRYLRFERMI